MYSIKYLIAKLFNRRPCSVFKSKIDKTAAIGNGAQIYDCQIAKYSYIYGSNAICVDIGAFTSIAEGCIIGGGNHPIDWCSTSPVFHSGKNVLHKNFSKTSYAPYRRTTIGNDVWIGSNSLIKGGITIGDGAVIGMGSVVTKNVPPYEIWGGNPAHFIKKRFDDETARKLSLIKWWELDDNTLNECGELFNDTSKLIEYLEEKKNEDSTY